MLQSTLISPAAGAMAAIVGTPPTAQRTSGDGSATPESFALALNQASNPPPPPAAPARQEARSDAAPTERAADEAPVAPAADSAATARAALQRKAATAASKMVDDKSASPGLPVASPAGSVPAPVSMQTGEAASGEHAHDGHDAGPDAAGLVAALFGTAAVASGRTTAKSNALSAGTVAASGAPGAARTGAAPAADAAAAAPAGPARGGESAAQALATADERETPSRPAAAAASTAQSAATVLPAAATPLPVPTPVLSAAGANPPTALEGRLQASPGSADFAPALGAQLNVFLREGVQHARLHLHPAELGPLTVQIQLDGTTAQLRLAAEHPLTRQALEQAMPTLAGTLRESGLTLTGGGVFEQPANPQPQHDARAPAGQRAASGREGRDTPAQADAAPLRAVMARRGVVDLVA